MGSVRFGALEYHADGSVVAAELGFQGSREGGWAIERNGRPWLDLGPGYRLLRTVECGVCSTDLARRFLPFPLPQVIGHELIAADEAGVEHVVEINASHRARGVAADCPFCDGGLDTHCPERLVLGIHALPGGFGPWVLAPVGAALPVPAEIGPGAAVLVEPFAAALNAVDVIRPRPGDTVAVLGTRRLGLLVVAALAARREQGGVDFGVTAVARRPALLELARGLGADRLAAAGTTGAATGLSADVVVDTTGTPGGLAVALGTARRELHVKSTHGQPAGGLAHLTELVVDELSIERFGDPGEAPGGLGGEARVAWLAGGDPPAALAQRAELVRADTAAGALEEIERTTPPGALPRAAAAVVASAEQIDQVVRPRPGREVSLLRPRGRILVLPGSPARTSPSDVVRAVAERGLRISTSRCGRFAGALDLLRTAPALQRLGELMVTHRFAAGELAQALATARTPACVKAVVTHRAP